MEQQKYIEGGFIKLYRSMLKWEWYDDINVKVLFLHLLLKANYEDKKWHGIEVKKGELITSINKLSEETGLSIQQIKTCLAKLQKTGEITNKATKQYTLISIEKYRFFQCYPSESNSQNNLQVTYDQPTSNPQVTYDQPTDNQRATITKELQEKKERQERQESIYQLIADMYNDTCVSFPKCTKLSEARKKALKARLKKYTVEDFKRLFETAQQCDYLKGANNKNWLANFDWLIADSNMAKTLDGNYRNRTPIQQENGMDIIKTFDFSSTLQKKITEWVTYKREKGNPYQSTSLHRLLSQIKEECSKHGEQAVIDVIDMSISNNYEGILWTKIAEGKTVQATPVKQNRFVNYEQRDWDFKELEKMERERIAQQADNRQQPKDERYAALLAKIEGGSSA